MSALKLLAAFLWSHMEKVVRGASITPLSNVLKFFTAAACPHVLSAGEDDTCTGRSQVQSASRPSLDEGHEQREKRKRPR